MLCQFQNSQATNLYKSEGFESIRKFFVLDKKKNLLSIALVTFF